MPWVAILRLCAQCLTGEAWAGLPDAPLRPGGFHSGRVGAARERVCHGSLLSGVPRRPLWVRLWLALPGAEGVLHWLSCACGSRHLAGLPSAAPRWSSPVVGARSTCWLVASFPDASKLAGVATKTTTPPAWGCCTGCLAGTGGVPFICYSAGQHALWLAMQFVADGRLGVGGIPPRCASSRFPVGCRALAQRRTRTAPRLPSVCLRSTVAEAVVRQRIGPAGRVGGRVGLAQPRG